MGWRCKGKSHANSGMYMGYAKYLKELLIKTMNYKCEDDQYIIFKNLVYKRHIEEVNSNAFFISFPGILTFDRAIKRAIQDYTQFMFTEIFITMILVIWLLPRKYKMIPIALFIILFIYINKSCIHV